MPLGTVDYIAPEEALDARRADIRADIYSLGCTLYRLLGGQVPFPGGDSEAKIRRHLTEVPTPVETLRTDLPPGLAPVVARMIAKELAARFQTPQQVCDVLTPFVQAQGRQILVVDDDTDTRQTMAALLQAQGFHVTTAANGKQALEQLRVGTLPGLILLDLMIVKGHEPLRGYGTPTVTNPTGNLGTPEVPSPASCLSRITATTCLP
jgi:serine/threonine protein kinase